MWAARISRQTEPARPGSTSIREFHYEIVQQPAGGETAPSSDPASEGSGSFCRKARTCLLDHEHVSDYENPRAAEGQDWRDRVIFVEVNVIW